ncbi:hypothetical protein NHF39_16570 [Pseudomonas proteolytica]|nr:hypothetical protein [Pseudomonas proteolytica]USW93178.1 hypothetical protein NHF39_16570 [Pseudomonas proteolytica]USW97849.1 hypothetical protein NHF41_14815 [Pseudomonas proteolytica]
MNIVCGSFKRVLSASREKLLLLARLAQVVSAQLLTDFSWANTALDQGFAQKRQAGRIFIVGAGLLAKAVHQPAVF